MQTSPLISKSIIVGNHRTGVKALASLTGISALLLLCNKQAVAQTSPLYETRVSGLSVTFAPAYSTTEDTITFKYYASWDLSITASAKDTTDWEGRYTYPWGATTKVTETVNSNTHATSASSADDSTRSFTFNGQQFLRTKRPANASGQHAYVYTAKVTVTESGGNVISSKNANSQVSPSILIF